MYGDGILVLDFGGHEGRAIARRVRGEQVFSTLLPISASLDQIEKQRARGIIIAGDPGYDAFSPNAPQIPEGVLQLNLPILGIGYGARILLRMAGAKLKGSQFGITAHGITFSDTKLFTDLELSDRTFDRLDDVELPQGYSRIAATEEGQCVAFENVDSKLWGMQFCPEANDPDGLLILRNFAKLISQAQSDWNMQNFIEDSGAYLRESVGDRQALIAISGGVDSAVCATLMHRALSDRLHCVHVDTGLMRAGEREMVQQYFASVGIPMQVIETKDRFISALYGLSGSAEKRDAMYREYGRVVKEALLDMGSGAICAQGTIYDDLLDEPAYWDHPNADLLEPLKMLFKDEVRELGGLMQLPPELVNRQAFPGPGLALRCMGAVTAEKIDLVRRADRIFREEIITAGLDKRVRQYFAVLTDTMTAGTQGTGHTIVLRAVNPGHAHGAAAFRMPYDLLERTCERITDEIPQINRVVYDVTSVPPGFIEWA